MRDLAGIDDHNHTLGAVFRHGGDIQGRAQFGTVFGSVAGLPGRQPVFLVGQLRLVLRGANDSDIVVLRNDMDKGVAPDYTDG